MTVKMARRKRPEHLRNKSTKTDRLSSDSESEDPVVASLNFNHTTITATDDATCLTPDNDLPPSPPQPPTLRILESPYDLVVKNTERKGRGVFTSKKISKGCRDPLIAQDAEAWVVDDRNLDATCSYCFGEREGKGGKSARCTGCRVLRYCSSQCQKKDWPDHKPECASFKNLFPRRPTTAVRLMARLIRFRNENLEKSRHVDQMESNRSKFEAARLESFAQMTMVVSDCLAPEPMPSAREAVDLWCKFTCNSYAITDGELINRGVGIFSAVALINHSCDPNCVVAFRGNTATVRCIRDIEPGEEVTLSYIDVTASKASRRAELKERYFFDCECSACVSDAPDPRSGYRCTDKTCDGIAVMTDGGLIKECSKCSTRTTSPSNDTLKQLEDAERETEKLEKKINSVHTGVTKSTIRCHLDALNEFYTLQSNHLHFGNHALVKTLKLQLDQLLSLAGRFQEDESEGEIGKRWLPALRTSEHLLKAYVLLLSDAHPSASVHRYLTSKLQLLVAEDRRDDGSLSEILKLQREAIRRLRISHGSAHPFVTNVVERAAADLEREIAMRSTAVAR